MREQAHLIQGEVALLMEDLSRLDDRTRKLQGHFLAAQRDVDQILTSSDKLVRRGAKIGALELKQAVEATGPGDEPRAVESRTGAPEAAGG